MTSFGSPRDVRGKHLKRIWEIVSWRRRPQNRHLDQFEIICAFRGRLSFQLRATSRGLVSGISRGGRNLARPSLSDDAARPSDVALFSMCHCMIDFFPTPRSLLLVPSKNKQRSKQKKKYFSVSIAQSVARATRRAFRSSPLVAFTAVKPLLHLGGCRLQAASFFVYTLSGGSSRALAVSRQTRGARARDDRHRRVARAFLAFAPPAFVLSIFSCASSSPLRHVTCCRNNKS